MFTAKNPGQTLGFGVHLRKAWGYIISTRLQFLHGTASGFNWQPSTGYADHGGNPWNSYYKIPGYSAGNEVFYNYKTNIDELSFQLVASLNNVKFHKARNKASLYALAGIGGSFMILGLMPKTQQVKIMILRKLFIRTTLQTNQVGIMSINLVKQRIPI